MKAAKNVNGPGSMKNAVRWAEECLGRILASGNTGRLIVESFDGPTDEMRGKFHAMIHDIAKSQRYFRGCDMGEKITHRQEAWKAVLVSAAGSDRLVPGYNGGLITVRPSSENLSKAAYCDCIEAAYQIGAELGVKWSEPNQP
jgi:hypothetical protein